MKTVKIL